MQAEQLREELRRTIILMDGAMGTYYMHLHPEAGEAELANLKHPEWIKEIHKKYIDAGAQMIRTNTFAVNHGLFGREQFEEVIGKAVENAGYAILEAGCQVAGMDALNRVWADMAKTQSLETEAQEKRAIYIAGSIGPIRMEKDMEKEDILAEYKEICQAMYEKNIRIFMLETFSDVELAKKLAGFIKGMGADTFVQVHYSVNRMGYTLYGQSAERVVRETEESPDVDGVGFNCGIGAAHMNSQLAKLSFSRDIVLGALPNAGYEQGLQGRQFLLDNPNYYAQTMEQVLSKGVNFVGGCCGTTPAHIKALSGILKDRTQPVQKNMVSFIKSRNCKREDNTLISRLGNGEKVYIVEIDSPFDGDGRRFLEAAKQLKEHHVDLVTISDSPMARPRAEAFSMGIYIGNETGIRVMPHVCCRDRNLIGLRSAMLGAHINGIRDVLIITGDPVGRDERGTITGVFDVNSIRLMEYVKSMNEEIFPEEPFYYGGALNYAGANIDAIEGRMRKKMEAGCSYFLTQPVYSDADIERVRELKKRTKAKIMVGLMPLVSYKNAIFMKNEMPGIDVPDAVIACYRPDMSREEAEDAAISVCVEIGEKVCGFADGYYLMTPFNRVGLVNRIMDKLRQCEERQQ